MTNSISRRRFAQATAGMAVLGVAGTASAQEGPSYDGWFDGVDNFDGTVDMTGEDSVEITVGAQGNGGAFAFDPAAVRVSPGTEVVWRWTGNGGGHNVVSDGDGPLDSGELVAEEGTTYTYTFEEEGTYKYVCEPHVSLGMKGAVVVGTSSGGSGGGEMATATPSQASQDDNESAAPQGRMGTADGPVGVLIAVIALAFFSPLVFAAVLRRKMRASQ